MTTQPKSRSAEDEEEPVERISSRTTAFVIIGIAVFLYAVQQILLPFVLAGAAAYICTPLVNALAARTRLPRPVFAVAIFLIILALTAGFVWVGGPALVREVRDFASDFQTLVEAIAQGALGTQSIVVFGQSMNAAQIAQATVNGARDWIGDPERMSRIASWSFAATFGFFLTQVLLFYFLLSGPSIARGLLWMVPPKQRPLIEHVWFRLDPVLKRYFIGVIVVVAYAVGVAYIGLGLVLGIKHAGFLALLTGLLEMIPVIGPGAAAVIAGVVAVHYATGLTAIIAYALYAAALRLSIDQLLGPIVLGSAARLHPIMVIFCFLSGGVLFGMPGVIMAVPLALTIKTTLAILYDEQPVEQPEPPFAGSKAVPGKSGRR